jgi:pimeloyl-[acyl-carrier protein] methyl ester esterase
MVKPPFTLVLLPGMDGTAGLFDPLLKALGTQWPVHCLRYPTNQAMGYAELTMLVRSELPKNEPYVLLGESFSGPIAIALASEADSNLLGLILCCTFARNPRPVLSVFRSLINAMPKTMLPTLVVSHLLLGKFATPVLRLAVERAVLQVDPEVMKYRLNAVIDINVTTQIAAVKVPTLYLRAKHDRLVPPAAAQLICQLNPSIKLVEINAPHCLLQTVPLEVAKIIVSWGDKLQ